jgi:16S rRNA (adenine1518-N6/adenine1519-N6)-dimethyltransferase
MKTRLDQHFLTDKRAISRIVTILDLSGHNVLEIGPGTGILTRALLEQGSRVTAIELDPCLVHELQCIFKDEIAAGRFIILAGDAARMKLPSSEYVVANLPYSASSKITFNLLETEFTDAILMYQKEFADRMMAPVGSRSCGRLSVMVQTYARVSHCFDLSPGCFTPSPKVRSSVVWLQPRPPLFLIHNHDIYDEIVRILFSERRKTLRSIFRHAQRTFGNPVITQITELLPEEILSARPEELYLEDYATIANLIHDIRTGVPTGG